VDVSAAKHEKAKCFAKCLIRCVFFGVVDHLDIPQPQNEFTIISYLALVLLNDCRSIAGPDMLSSQLELGLDSVLLEPDLNFNRLKL